MIEALQNQLNDVQSRIANEKQKGAEADRGLIASLESQEAQILSQMDEAKRQQDQQVIQQQHKERVEQAVTESSGIIESMASNGLNVRQLSAGDNEYQLLSIRFQQVFRAQAEELSKQIATIQAEHKDQIRAADDREAQLKRQNAELQQKTADNGKLLNEALDANRLLTDKANQFEAERDDFAQKLQNAAIQLDDSNKEVKRLNEQVDDLRKEIAVGVRAAITVIDTPDQIQQLRDLSEKIKAGRIRVVNMRPLDNLGTKYGAEDAYTGETYEFGFLEKGKYLELTDPNEVEQFRQQRATELSQSHQTNPPLDALGNIDIPPLPVNGEQFRQEDVPTGTPADDAGVSQSGGGQAVEAGGAENSSSEGTEVSRHEFEALKRRVATLESVCSVEAA